MSRLASAVLLLVAASVPAAVVHAEVYKCTEPDGRKVYQDRPCDAGQQAAPYDASRANVTTIDSEASRREAQEALVTRAAGQKDEDQGDDQSAAYEPNVVPTPAYEPEPVYYPYPVYRNHDHHHDHGHHGRPTVPQRPDETPMSPPRRGGGGYVPNPPTVRDVAPRPPASSSSSSSRAGRTRSRDDDR